MSNFIASSFTSGKPTTNQQHLDEGQPQRKRVIFARVFGAVVIAVIFMLPMYWMLRVALAPVDELSTLPVPLWPENWSWSNFTQPWSEYPFGRWLANSVVIATVSVILTVIINLAAGFAFAKLRFPFRDLIFLLILSSLMVPVQVIMIPQFQVVIDLNMLNTPWAVVLPRLAEAFGLFMARQFFLTVPDELIDAAKCDGASYFRIFWQIMVPLSKPLVAALVIFTFMWRWNEFVWPLIVLTEASSYTLPVGLQFLVQQYSSDFGPLMAMSFLAMLPMLLVFGFFQRHFIEGVARTGIK